MGKPKKTAKELVMAREAFKTHFGSKAMSDKQKQVFIGAYVKIMRLPTTEAQSKSDDALAAGKLALEKRDSTVDPKRTEYDRDGKKYEKNVLKAEKKANKIQKTYRSNGNQSYASNNSNYNKPYQQRYNEQSSHGYDDGYGEQEEKPSKPWHKRNEEEY
ncbi:hypothetical protein BC833DRAFT_569119 [Globomyces pollinis-pini]|nr:hypothetical protein BC833DRAFT_569119 [Globomyces pollinis-pini]